MSRILLGRIGWMKFYNGPMPGDAKPIGGGSWNKENVGGEINNFRIFRGKVLGVIQNAEGATKLNLRRIAPKANDGVLKNVLIIFFARDPRPNSKGQVLIGWHKNATVKATYSETPWWHFSEASAKNATLLPSYNRTQVVPRGKNAPGQANVFFALDSNSRRRSLPWLQRILQFIDSYTGPNLLKQPEAEAHPDAAALYDRELSTSFSQGAQMDPGARKAIENAAMNAARRYFQRKGYKIINVSSSKPYDLHCLKNGHELFVEVKGSQTPASKILLTPNEVKFAKSNSRKMVLFVLHSVRVKRKRRIFRAYGGLTKIIKPWTIHSKRLEPVQFFYSLQ